MSTTALSKIIREAKSIRRKHPNKYKGKKNSWAKGYMAEAAKKYNSGKLGTRKKKKSVGAVKKKAKPRKKPRARAKPKPKPKPVRRIAKRRKSKRKVGTKKPVKVTTRRSVERTVGRRRSVGKKDKTMLFLGLGALLLGGVYLLTKSKTPTYPTGSVPLTMTGNTTRNNQSSDILNYAIAGGLALDAITKLIQSLNSSSDGEVDSYYKQLNTTGQLDTGLWA